MPSRPQLQDVANQFIEDTSQTLTTLQSIQMRLKSWRPPAAGSKQPLRQPYHSSKDDLDQLRRTVETSRKRFNRLSDRLLEEIQATEDLYALTEGVKRSDCERTEKTFHATLTNKKALPFRKDRQRARNNPSQRSSRANIVKALAAPHTKAIPPTSTPTNSHVQAASLSLRYGCDVGDLGVNMVSTILRARTTLGEHIVDEHGYLILTTSISWDRSTLQHMLETKTCDESEYTHAFVLQNGGDGFHHIYRNDEAELKCHLPTLETGQGSIAPEQDFQASVDSVTDNSTSVSYLVGPHASNTEEGLKIGRLLDPGPVTSKRPELPGINTPYWYVSYEQGAPTTMHIEDGFAGSANMLLAGAEKHWIVVRRGSVQKFENCVRKEFHRSQKCSQFVRHHNVIFSPRWLEKRNIEYDMVCQRPGEIMVTLPGFTYHQVRNTGANFAIAINYEFPDAPMSPSDYRWCIRGPRRCGPNAVRLRDFQGPEVTSSSTNEGESHSRSAPDYIELSDDGTYELDTFLRLPDQDRNVSSDVQNLIQACIDQSAAPHWFQCKDSVQLEAKLQQFLPGNMITDDILEKLLKLIALRRGYGVAESLTLNLTQISASEIMESNRLHSAGVVLPFHVNAAEQASHEGRDHWVLAVLDLHANVFTTWGIDEVFARRWYEAFALILDNGQHLELSLNQLPENPDGASCALCCCYALDVLLGTSSHGLSIDNMRSYYLRKLLEGYRTSTVQHQLTGRSAVAVPISQESSLHEVDKAKAFCEATWKIATDIPDLHKALADTSLPSQERKTRIIQMILQCSADEFERLLANGSASHVARDELQIRNGVSNIFALVEQIEDSTDMYLRVLRSRFLLIKLHSVFTKQMKDLAQRRGNARVLRRREKSSGHTPKPLPSGSRTTLKNAVMDRIIATIPGTESQSQRSWRARLTRHLQVAETYFSMVSILGYGILLGLPYKEAAPCDLRNFIPDEYISRKPIHVNEYTELSSAEADYFIRWFQHLNPDLEKWNARNFFPICMDETYWEEIKKLQANVFRVTSSGTKRAGDDSMAFKSKDDGKKQRF